MIYYTQTNSQLDTHTYTLRIYIYNNQTGFDLASDRPYLVQPARSTPFPLTRLPSGALRSAGELRWGDGWVGTECWYHAPYGLTTAAAARITAVCSNLLPHINYSSSRQDDVLRRCNMWTLYAFCSLWPWTPLYRSLTHRLSLASRCLGYCRLFVHVGLD